MKKPFIYLFFVIYSTAFSQRPVEPTEMKTFNIIVNYEDYSVKTQMLKDPKKICVNNDLCYLWYNSNKITETKGGYDGKLLHGYYKSFYAFNNQLRESGQIKYGLKNKEWKYWYTDGKLREVITWKKGRKNGKYILYNDYGEIMAKGNFKNDLLHGKFYTYDKTGRIAEKKRYKNGNEIISKPKTEKVKKNKEGSSETREKRSFKERVKAIFKKKEKTDKPKKEKRKNSTEA